MRKHRFLLATLLGLLPFVLFANSVNTLSYIEKFKDIAIREMHRSGIPASITLAQAIHESAWGQGTLAKHSNNYFGIKCKDYWTGPTYYIEDDDRNAAGKLIKSCFRAYENIENSFVDHSDFLRDNPRYSLLFQYALNDYRNWANGLQNCGYATDPAYAQKLIRTIERYQLHEYDTISKPLAIETMPTPQVAAAPLFDLSAYTSSVPTPVSPTIGQPAPFIEEESYDIPDAYVLPDDYQRGDLRNEEYAPLILNEPQEALYEEPQSALPPSYPTPVDTQEVPAMINTPQTRIAEKPIAQPTPTPAETTLTPIIRMSYAKQSRGAQLSRQPRVSSSQRR